MTPLSLAIKNDSGELVTTLSIGTERGALLALTFEMERMGGVVNAEFSVAEGLDVPFFMGNPVTVIANGEEVLGFDIKSPPDNRGKDGLVLVECAGYCERLKNVVLTTTLTSVSLTDAALSLATLAGTVGITIDSAHLSLPAHVISSMEYEDATLFDVMSDLIDFANGASGVDAYAWEITVDRYLRVYDTRDIASNAYYEGFHFQSPEIDTSFDEMINTIKLWRKTSTGSDEEYVGTYEDAGSIDLYGVYEERIDLDYYASNADCAVLASGILARAALPQRRVTVSSMPVALRAETPGLPFCTYSLFYCPRLVWKRLFSGTDEGVFDLSFASGTTVSTSPVSLIGKTSVKCELSSSAAGYISLPFDPAILMPRKIRIYAKAVAGTQMIITLVDSNGDGIAYPVTFDGAWMRLSINYETSVSEATIAMKRDTDETDYALALLRDTDETNYAATLLNRNFIASLKEIRFHWVTASVDIYLGYIDVLSRRWEREDLPLNRAKYQLANDTVLAEAEFGGKRATTTDELTEMWTAIRRRSK